MEIFHPLISQAYAAFNARDIPRVLATLHPQVRWARAWEGDYATGHGEVRDYWLRQWQELNPHVEPTAIQERAAAVAGTRPARRANAHQRAGRWAIRSAGAAVGKR
jgi:hypothetical protein